MVLGFSKVITSDFNQDEALKNNQEMIELYSKYVFNENVSLTPTIQLYKNPQIDSALVNKIPNELYNLSLRLNYQF